MNDTSPEMRRQFHEVLMTRTPQQRVAMAAEMFDTARRIVLSSLPSEWSEADKKVALVKRFYGRDLDPEFMDQVAEAIRESA
ncbi:MAG TPA: hypothetical protein VLU25_02245 [Acidobacteriota bacterium]|nr:hypothetical protein [Acidobacteriota bacterium]